MFAYFGLVVLIQDREIDDERRVVLFTNIFMYRIYFGTPNYFTEVISFNSYYSGGRPKSGCFSSFIYFSSVPLYLRVLYALEDAVCSSVQFRQWCIAHQTAPGNI